MMTQGPFMLFKHVAVFRGGDIMDIARGEKVAGGCEGSQWCLHRSIPDGDERPLWPARPAGIDIDRNGIEAPLADEFLDPHDQFLGAPDGESRDDDLALVEAGMMRRSSAFCLMLSPVGFVQAIAVGRLKNQHVAWRRGSGSRRIGMLERPDRR